MTPAPGATAAPNSQQQPPPSHPTSVVDPLAPKISAPSATYNGIVPPAIVNSNSTGLHPSPTGVADLSVFPSWVDAKNPPVWYNDGEDIDKLLEDADDLNWLVDTGDLDETFSPALEAMREGDQEDGAVMKSEEFDLLEPAPVQVGESGAYYDGAEEEEPSTGGRVKPERMVEGTTAATAAADASSPDNLVADNPITHPSVESLSFLVDSPKTELDAGLPPVTFPIESTGPSSAVLPAHRSGEPRGDLMSFPDLDMGDEHAFVSALLDTGNKGSESALSFSKWGSQNGVAEMENEEEQ